MMKWPWSYFRQPEPLTDKPPSGETAWASRSFFGAQGTLEAWNPDRLLQNKGAEVYRDMLRDDQVKAAYAMRQSAILSRKWRFEFDEEDAKQGEIAEFFERVLDDHLKGSFIQTLQQILLSEAFGYSITEMVFDVATVDGATRWVLCATKARPFETFRFRLDAYGNLQELIQEQTGTRKVLDPQKFIYHVSNPHQDTTFGESHLRAAYQPYWRKINILNFWNVYLERMAGGMVVAKVTGNLSDTSQANLRDVLTNLSARSGIQLPEGVDLDVLMSKGGESGFESAVDNADTAIARALLTPNLLGLTPQRKFGGNAQSSTQKDVYDQLIGLPSEELAEVLNEQLFRRLAWWNFGVERFPRFTFEPLSDEQKVEVVKQWTIAVEKGTVKNTLADEQRTRGLLGYDPREDDDEEEEVEAPKADVEVVEGDYRFVQPQGGPGNKPWLDRVNFAQAESTLDTTEAQLTEELSTLLRGMFQELIAVVGELDLKSPPEQLTAELATAMAPDQRKAINRTWQRGLRTVYTASQVAAQTEIRQALYRQQRFAQAEKTIHLTARAIPWKEEPPTVARFVQQQDLLTAEEYFQNRAFWLTGQMTDAILAEVQTALLNGIRDGLSVDEMVAQIEPLVTPYLGERDAAGRRINPGHRMETIVRTNVIDAFNQARLTTYTDPDLEGFVEALEYQAIMDARTTPFCRSMDGKVYPIGDAIWQRATPPNHYNCRSTLVAVTELDEWQASPPLPASQQPATGFGGK